MCVYNPVTGGPAMYSHSVSAHLYDQHHIQAHLHKPTPDYGILHVRGIMHRPALCLRCPARPPQGHMAVQGYGRLLMEAAERIAAKEHRSTLLAVISGVGTRHYYRKLGYRLQGPYMVKSLAPASPRISPDDPWA